MTLVSINLCIAYLHCSTMRALACSQEGMLGSSPKSLGRTKSRWLQQRERLAREFGEYAVSAWGPWMNGAFPCIVDS